MPVNFPSYVNAPFGQPSVVAFEGGFRVALRLLYKVDGVHLDRSVIYEPDGSPMVVWREPQGSPPACLVDSALLAPGAVWLNVSDTDQNPGQAYYALSLDNVRSAASPLAITEFFQRWDANDDLAALWLSTGDAVLVYDRTVDTGEKLPPTGSYPDYARPWVAGGGVLMSCSFTLGVSVICSWRRANRAGAPGQVAQLLGRDGYGVPAAAGDGQNLVWIETSLAAYAELGAGTIYTSPFTLDPAELSPQARGTSPEAIRYGTASRTQNGLFAVARWTGQEATIHVYRLSDMHYWRLDIPTEAGVPNFLPYLDEHEVWYYTGSNVVRQELGDG